MQLVIKLNTVIQQNKRPQYSITFFLPEFDDGNDKDLSLLIDLMDQELHD